MDSTTYWKNREAEQRKHDIKDEQEYQKRIEEIYQNMIDEIEMGSMPGKKALRWRRRKSGPPSWTLRLTAERRPSM